MHNFFDEWDLKENPLYIAGSSYAGHYIPVLARDIMNNRTLGFNLKGVMIGGAYVDPETQVNFYDSYMYSVGIVSEAGRSTSSAMQNEAIIKMLNLKYSEASSDIDWFENTEINKKYFGSVDLENYRDYEERKGPEPYETFLEVNKKVFGVPDHVTFIKSNQRVFRAFGDSGDYSKSMGSEVGFVDVSLPRF